MILALAGGVGGAKLAAGLYASLPPDALTVVVNTGDDFDLYGLRISPDADTVLYTLAGLANPEAGWGIAGDTFETLSMLTRYGENPWFRLGDRDFATHILRTQRLREGWPPSHILAELTAALGVRAALLPMCETPVATMVRTPAGELAFQDYFVARHHADEVLGVRFAGIEEAELPSAVREAAESAAAVIFCPSNPVVSIGPILAVPGLRDLLRGLGSGRRCVPIVAVSPIVGGKALRGPADRMLAGVGVEVSSFGVASLYRDLLAGIVIDTQDAAEAGRIEALGIRTLVTNTIMGGNDDRKRLAGEVLAFAGELRGGAECPREDGAS
ncbi:MAG TPA: 2-phospho-L-lactate transferase [Ktedonobacterales bacterium]|nr:2-phospho-L-lactate transferase [Ktedonobacterales bacterium]